MKGYGPPRSAYRPPVSRALPSFLRLPCPPHLTDVDAAIVGLPFDAASCRAGARFGPRAIRERSLPMWPQYNTAQRVAVFDRLSAVDYGDAPVVPGFTDRSLEQDAGDAARCARGRRRAHRARRRPHRAARRAAGRGRHARPRGAHPVRRPHDADDDDFGAAYGHGTPVRRALEEGLIDAERSTILGLRGGLSGPGDYDDARDGFAVFPWDELMQLGTGRRRGRRRAGRRGKAFLTFDIDFVDPAFAPGTGTPESAARRRRRRWRCCAAVGACRSWAPTWSRCSRPRPLALTATLAATVAWEILAPRGRASATGRTAARP